jgi:hypothetical protein
MQTTARERTRLLPATVTLSVVAPPRAQPPVRVSADQTKPPLPVRTVIPSAAPKATPETNKPTRVDKAPVDLTGVTLTGGEGSGWASTTGNGQTIEAPIRPTIAAAPAVDRLPPSGLPRGAHLPPPVEVVPAKDLATKPTPPALNTSLVANYPVLAKQQGLAGSAKLLVRVDSDGVVRQCTIQSESSAGFGAACRRTLLGSRWSPPRDRLGNAVVTQVYYTCDFRVTGS